MPEHFALNTGMADVADDFLHGYRHPLLGSAMALGGVALGMVRSASAPLLPTASAPVLPTATAPPITIAPPEPSLLGAGGTKK